MKPLLIGAILMLIAGTAKAEDVFEIVSTKFKEGISLEEQKQSMAKLNQVVGQFPGFRSRQYYYSSESGRWIDVVLWTDIESAKKASEQAMINPTSSEVFVKMDESSTIFSYYEKVGGISR